MTTSVTWIGRTELLAAIKRNPATVVAEANKFLSRGLAAYKRVIVGSPWRVGGAGGGSPVSNDPRYPRRYQRTRAGNLRDTHKTVIMGSSVMEGRIFPTAPYARYVHDGTRGMRSRPWLLYAKATADPSIRSLYRAMLETITKDLAK